MPKQNRQRTRRRRNALRDAGLRPVRIWVPDTRGPGFAEECRRQSQAVAAADAADGDLNRFPSPISMPLHGLTPPAPVNLPPRRTSLAYALCMRCA